MGVSLLRDLMRQYAVQGLHDWRENTEERVRTRAVTSLGNKIASTDKELYFEIGRPRPTKFFPMPKFGYGKEIDYCFFLPRVYESNGLERWTFVLFVLTNGRENLAFRFEPASGDKGKHDYAHIQFCRTVIGADFVPAGIPAWIPERDLAFPLPSSDPVKLFLSMATAVHGRSGGVDKVIINMFQRANQVNATRKYIGLLTEMFG